MTVDNDLQEYGAFDVAQSDASLWIFKKRASNSLVNPFTVVSVVISDALESELKSVVRSYQGTHTFADAYNLLSQPAEDGFLSVLADGTLFLNLRQLVDKPIEECLVKDVKQLNNAAGYVFRLRHLDKVIYCVKKTNSDWATRKKSGMMNIVFNHSGLDIVENPSFTIAKNFDFFMSGIHVFMANKAAFESLLSHRVTYESAYADLKQEAGFTAAIANIGTFDTYIGRNATHLRRMAVIKARGYYNNPDYMARLREINTLRSWGIQFDLQGRIVATLDKMSDILHILLDHRLRSELSENQYDVPSTTQVD